MRYSASVGGFYPEDFGGELPDDLVEISAEYHAQLMAAQNVGAEIKPDVNGVPQAVFPAPPSAAEVLEAERAGMQPFARAFFAALALFPAPGHLHMLDAYTQVVAASRAADPYSALVIWDQRVTQVLRLHPDMEAFRVQFDIAPEVLDAIFRAAMQIEAGT